MAIMRVELLTARDEAIGDFFGQAQGASIYHLQAWGEMVAGALSHTPFYLVARSSNAVKGVLPLMLIRSRFFGRRLVSQAFSNYGGPLAESPAAIDALYNRAVKLATQHGAESIEFRNTTPMPYGLHTRRDKVCLRYPLVPEPDMLWKSFSSKSKVRNHVRKAENSGVEPNSGGEELLDDFYRVWTVRMRQLGTPCYPRKLFSSILRRFPDNARIFVARLGHKTIAARFTISFDGLAESRWGATLVEYNGTRANHYLYWRAMKYYAEAGAKWFDFGRSTIGSSQYQFKKQWGAEKVNLHYQYWVRPGHDLSIASPDNPKFSRKVEVWKRLPLWATRLLGPFISRSLA